jgi:uncharacterized protein (DUF2336 family)
MSEVATLVAELDAALQKTSGARRRVMLQSVITLFFEGAETFSEDHIAVFDDVMSRLIEKAERPVLIELSGRLAPLCNAPPKVIDRLARHDDIAISGPLLNDSHAVTDRTLADVAKLKSEKHLSAIAARPVLREAVTDALVDRCSAEAARKVANNMDATLSEVGFVKLINRAKTDKVLAAAIESRTDLPAELVPFLKLTLV